MKDQLALLATAVIFSLAAWLFWHYLGVDGANIIGIIVIVSLVVDNRRLRAQLRDRAERPPD